MAHNQYHNTTSENDNINTRAKKVELRVNSFEMDLSDLSDGATNRSFTIRADKGAGFSINIVQKSSSSSVLDKFYNWKTNSFTSDFTTSHTLDVKMVGKIYNNSVSFPAGNAGDYFITIFSLENSNTIFSPSTGAAGKKILAKKLTQVSTSNLILSPATTNSSYYKTFPTTTITSSITNTEVRTIEFSWEIENADSDTYGFGLRDLTESYTGEAGKVPLNEWYFETTAVTATSFVSASKIQLTDVSNLAPGMIVVSGSGLSGTPEIVSISQSSGMIALSTPQTLLGGVTLTFRAYGANTISNIESLETSFDMAVGTLIPVELTKTVRTNSSGTTVDLNGTYGIAGGNHVTVGGLNVNNLTANTVASVSASSTAGSMVMTLDQTGVTAGTTLTFTGSSKKIKISGEIKVTKQPKVNTTIYLNLDNILAVGAAS